jgi:hypothetical protein
LKFQPKILYSISRGLKSKVIEITIFDADGSATIRLSPALARQMATALMQTDANRGVNGNDLVSHGRLAPRNLRLRVVKSNILD